MLSLNALPQNALPQLGGSISSQQPDVWNRDLRRRNPNEGTEGLQRTLEEVGKQFDVTRAPIRQIEAKALRKGTFGCEVIGLQDDKPKPKHVLESKPSAPVQFFVKLLEIWELDLDSACVLLGYEKSSRSHFQAVLSGAVPLETRDEKDRIAELFVIRKILHSVFRDRKVENQWLREPQSLLDGSSPLDLLLEGSWPNLLRVRQFTEMMAGL